MELEQKKIPNKNLGYFTYIVAQIFRYLTLLLVLTSFTMATGGIGGIIGVIFFTLILKLIPFRISLYDNFKKYLLNEIDLNKLHHLYKEKLKYTNILSIIIIISAILILVNDDNLQDRLFFSIFFFVLLLLLVPQYKYLNFIKREYIGENILITIPIKDEIKPINTNNKKFSLYNFYFGNDSTTIVNEKQTENPTDINQISDNIKNYTKKIEFRKGKIFEKLTSDEVIIISIIVGCIFCIIFGNLFGETQHFKSNGERISNTSHYLYEYSTNDFNYIMAVIGFIITAGISYIFLNRKSNNSNKND